MEEECDGDGDGMGWTALMNSFHVQALHRRSYAPVGSGPSALHEAVRLCALTRLSPRVVLVVLHYHLSNAVNALE